MSNKKKDVKDHTKELPRPRAYVVGGGFDYIRLLFSLGCDGAKGVDDADFVVFTGGEDVNPELYGEIALAKTRFNRDRDIKEQAIYRAALDRELPMVGICRGGQFLNVMNGGRMWQHVNNHTGNHIIRVEIPPFVVGNKRRSVMVTSTHHQMMIPADHAIIIATADIATEKDRAGKSVSGRHDDDPDTEVVFYDDTNCLCFQPHPEVNWAPADCVDFFEECLDDWIYPRIPLRKPSIIIPNATKEK
jgi:anthranilate/para-aminobenzoate synthase component II